MAWATSSSARTSAGVLAVLLALALTGAPRAQEGSAAEDAWSAARAILAEAMFLESGLGNLQAACDLYEEGLRIEGLDVRLQVSDEIAGSARWPRCTGLFEDFCVVTASIRQGIPVNVEIVDEAGQLLQNGE